MQDYEPLEVTVSQLACPQTNTGNFLQPNSKPFAAGEYSFDLQVQDLTYQFEFGVNATDTVTDTQQKIARLINQADIGLNAQLLTDGLGNLLFPSHPMQQASREFLRRFSISSPRIPQMLPIPIPNWYLHWVWTA